MYDIIKETAAPNEGKYWVNFMGLSENTVI
jgi:hypothetical protein